MTDEDITILYNGKTQEEILINMVYSYSSVNSFSTCALGFKLMYLDKVKRGNNPFGQIGNVVHSVFESYFIGFNEKHELSKMFLDTYPKEVVAPLPPNMQNWDEKNISLYSNYFDKEFDMNREEWEVLCVENKYTYEVDDVKIVIKPDLILKKKEDGLVTLFDYKTSKWTGEKFEGYSYQTNLYADIYEIVTGIHIDAIEIIFPNDNRKKKSNRIVTRERVLDDFVSKVKTIRQEKDWSASPDEFFCCWLCSASASCPVKERLFGI